MHTFSICRGQTRIGVLECREDGLYLDCAAVCTSRSPVRLILTAEGGELPLGVPVPEGSALRLRRRVSLSSLRPLGRITGCRAAEACAAPALPEGWLPAPDLKTFVTDPELGRLSLPAGSAIRKEREILRLAVPYRPEEPFPLMPLFCFAEICRLAGRDWAVFTFRNGLPG